MKGKGLKKYPVDIICYIISNRNLIINTFIYLVKTTDATKTTVK